VDLTLPSPRPYYGPLTGSPSKGGGGSVLRPTPMRLLAETERLRRLVSGEKPQKQQKKKQKQKQKSGANEASSGEGIEDDELQNLAEAGPSLEAELRNVFRCAAIGPLFNGSASCYNPLTRFATCSALSMLRRVV